MFTDHFQDLTFESVKAKQALNFPFDLRKSFVSLQKRIMLRNIIAILAGIITGLISIAIIEYFGQELFPTPANLVLDEELYNNDKAYEMIPLPAMLMVLLAYLIGSFVAGFTSASIGQRKSLALVSGFFLLIGGLVNILLIPHPLWFTIVSLALFVPFALFGGFVAEKLLIKKK